MSEETVVTAVVCVFNPVTDYTKVYCNDCNCDLWLSPSATDQLTTILGKVIFLCSVDWAKRENSEEMGDAYGLLPGTLKELHKHREIGGNL